MFPTAWARALVLVYILVLFIIVLWFLMVAMSNPVFNLDNQRDIEAALEFFYSLPDDEVDSSAEQDSEAEEELSALDAPHHSSKISDDSSFTDSTADLQENLYDVQLAGNIYIFCLPFHIYFFFVFFF